MTRLKGNKLNYLVAKMSPGMILTSEWLKQQGISSKLAWWYVKSHWLERLGDKVYRKPGDNVTWIGALSALQNQLQFSVHVGGKTALELLGQTHFIPINGIKRVIIFNNSKAKIPHWFNNSNTWDVKFLISKSISLYKNEAVLGVISKVFDGINLQLSSPERAALEVLFLVPNKQSFDEAAKLIESLNQLRPNLLQNLLEQCNSIKTKRLFLYFAEKYQHPWLGKLDLAKINLGKGKRVIGKGGDYNSKYQISVPKIMDE